MSQVSRARLATATERLYALLPAHIRSRDAAQGGPLAAYMQVLAGACLELDHEIDALYEALFVETAPDGALADLAALVGSEPLRPLPPGSGYSPRAFIANTLRYRRGKGTARVLEELAADVAGVGAVAVEYYMRLARTQCLIDVRPERPGTALLQPGETAARAATAFDTLPRLVDVRSIARSRGRYHVPNVGVHVLRSLAPAFPAPAGTSLPPKSLAGVPVARPWPDATVQHPGYFQIAAQPGRPLRLFNPDRRSQRGEGRAREVDLPDRLRRLPLHLETESLRRADVEGRVTVPGPWFDSAGQPFTIFLRAAGSTTFDRVAPAEILISNLEAFPLPAGARPAAEKLYKLDPASSTPPVSRRIRCGFDPVTGRIIVAAPKPGEADVEEVRVAYATGAGSGIGAGPHERNDETVAFELSAALADFVRFVDATAAETGGPTSSRRTVRTLDTALAEWSTSAGRSGYIVLVRCDRAGSGPQSQMALATRPGTELHIVSARWQPSKAQSDGGYLVRKEQRFTIDARLYVSAASPPAPGERPGLLTLDGVEITSGVTLAARAVSRLRLRHAVVRAPGQTALASAAPLEGTEIVIEHSVVGRIGLEQPGGTATGSISIANSIVSSDEAAGDAIDALSLDARLMAVTVLGSSRFKSLEASNAILTGACLVTRRQIGCVRYSSVAEGSAMPRRFRCQPDLAIAAATERKGGDLAPGERASAVLGVAPSMLDTSLDEPTLAMLHPMASDAIRLGGEGGAEMGAFSAAASGLRLANLEDLFNDYVPFGLEAGIIDDTRSSTVALRRNRP